MTRLVPTVYGRTDGRATDNGNDRSSLPCNPPTGEKNRKRVRRRYKQRCHRAVRHAPLSIHVAAMPVRSEQQQRVGTVRNVGSLGRPRASNKDRGSPSGRAMAGGQNTEGGTTSWRGSPLPNWSAPRRRTFPFRRTDGGTRGELGRSMRAEVRKQENASLFLLLFFLEGGRFSPTANRGANPG